MGLGHVLRYDQVIKIAVVGVASSIPPQKKRTYFLLAVYWTRMIGSRVD